MMLQLQQMVYFCRLSDAQQQFWQWCDKKNHCRFR